MFNFFFKKLHDWKKYVYSICKTVLSVSVSSHVNWKNIKSTALLRMAVFTYRRAEQFILFIWAILYFHLKADTLTLQSYWGFYIKKKKQKKKKDAALEEYITLLLRGWKEVCFGAKPAPFQMK